MNGKTIHNKVYAIAHFEKAEAGNLMDSGEECTAMLHRDYDILVVLPKSAFKTKKRREEVMRAVSDLLEEELRNETR